MGLCRILASGDVRTRRWRKLRLHLGCSSFDALPIMTLPISAGGLFQGAAAFHPVTGMILLRFALPRARPRKTLADQDLEAL